MATSYTSAPTSLTTLIESFCWNPTSTQAASHDAPPQSIDRPWVLSIDDDEEFSHGLKLGLQSRGYDVVRAFDGMGAYRFAVGVHPVAILLDLYLPHTTGEKVLAQLRFHPRTSGIPVAIVTGMREPALNQRLLLAGATEVFHKPLSFSQLADAIDGYRTQVNA